MTKLRLLLVFAVPLSAYLSGCSRPAKPNGFEPNRVLVQVTKAKVGDDVDYPVDSVIAESTDVMTKLFGTPDDPKLPESLTDEQKSLINSKYLELAAGPPVKRETAPSASGAQAIEVGQGLFRFHCSSCHGVSGNGRGSNALQGDVYPRDFRLGKFKFKSTTRGAKPTKEDLFATIRNGIAGTPMVAFGTLPEEDVKIMVDYVIYLAMRGEVERRLIAATEEIAFENQEHLYAPGSPGFDDQKALVDETVAEVADSWLASESKLKKAAEITEFPTNATVEELRAAAASNQDSPLKASIERGKALYAADRATCYKCHGPKGHGDGAQQDYDDWTKDWIGDLAKTLNTSVPMTEAEEDALLPLQALGALPPRKVMPRDFRKGVYRGGGDPQKLYLRIAQGIDGTPMPAAEGVLQPEEIWSLVNYVRSLEEKSTELAAAK